MEEASTSPARRRLPTKTRSGLITIPAAGNSPPQTSISADAADSEELLGAQLVSSPAQSRSPLSNPGPAGPCSPCTTAEDSQTRDGQPNTAESPASTSMPAQQPPTRSWGPARTVPKPPPLKTGPLNASSTPQAQALPVKRRGSYQSLKRNTEPSQSHIKSEGEPSVISLLKKSTHWERFGTILVQYCTKSKAEDCDGVLQMLCAEGYDAVVSETQTDAILTFSTREVFPDLVILDSEHPDLNTIQFIKQLQAKNPTVAIIVLGAKAGRVDAVSALQGGASDFMLKPIDLDELVARIERHVQRQHCIKLELERALEDARNMMAKLAPTTMLGDMMFNTREGEGAAAAAAKGLISVAETDFEEQMQELSDENQRLGAKLADMERKLEIKDHENRMLEAKLNAMEIKMDANSDGVQGALNLVTEQNNVLMYKVGELEKMIQGRGSS